MAIGELDAGPDPFVAKPVRDFLGHPIGLPVIAFTEAFERFSYYGMQTLLVLYMVKALLLPGRVENIIGFDVFASDEVKNYMKSLVPLDRIGTPDEIAKAALFLACLLYTSPSPRDS